MMISSDARTIYAAAHMADKSYQCHVSVLPVKHDYGDGHYKYSCPICESLGLRFQLTRGADQCFCCGVNLYWDDE
jgi:hypothetical protein